MAKSFGMAVCERALRLIAVLGVFDCYVCMHLYSPLVADDDGLTYFSIVVSTLH
jgi:hypothetical protein